MELLVRMIWLFLVTALANVDRGTGNNTTAILSPSASISQLPASSSITNVTSGTSDTLSSAVAATPTSAPTTPAPATPAPTTAAPTTPATPTPVPGDAKQFKGELALADTFDNKLKNKTSQEFKDLADKVTKALEDVYKSITGFLKIVIDAFKPGSTVVEFRVIFQGNSAVTEEKAAKSIKDALSDGKIGGLSVVENSIKVTQVGGPTTEPPTTATDLMLQNLFIVMVVGVFLVGLVFILLIVVLVLLARLWRARKAMRS